jgi:hypothetical protein
MLQKFFDNKEEASAYAEEINAYAVSKIGDRWRVSWIGAVDPNAKAEAPRAKAKPKRKPAKKKAEEVASEDEQS